MSMTLRTLKVLPGFGSQNFSTTLQGKSYRFRVYYNQRTAKWYTDIRDANGEALILGLRLAIRYPLLGQYKNTMALPPGELMVLDLQNSLEEHTFESLTKLFYLDTDPR